jgi:hypothetical protein
MPDRLPRPPSPASLLELWCSSATSTSSSQVTSRTIVLAPFEYDFYQQLTNEHGLIDSFRVLHRDSVEHSWVGRTGDGYRYDHAHCTADLASKSARLQLQPPTSVRCVKPHLLGTIGSQEAIAELLSVPELHRALLFTWFDAVDPTSKVTSRRHIWI